MVYVQAVIRSDLQKKADLQFSGQEKPTALRYKILDRNSLPLAETVKVFSCYVDPKMVNEKKRLAQALARELKINPQQFLLQFGKNKSSFMWVKRNVDPAVVVRLEKEKLRGLGFKAEYRRHYPQGVIASHLLGLVGVDDVGLSGIEMSFQKSLCQKNKNTEIKGHVQLTLDSYAQKIAEKELMWGVDKTNAKSGIILIQEPRTGEILAMASWPPLSLNPDAPPSSLDLRIPALVDVFEPGSTFKVVTAAAALEENIIRPGEVWSGEDGAWPVMGITIHDYKPHKKLTFEEIWMYSSNIGSAKIAERLGRERLYQYARSFGFGVFPGTSLSGEAKGTLRHPSQWSGVSQYVVSFGQEVSVSALQLVGAYSAIANGGELMEPRLIKSIRDDEDNVLWNDSPSVVRRVISSKTARELTNILTRVVSDGSGQNAKLSWNDKIKAAGKTGTAQKFDNKLKRYRNDLSLVSFCGFFPADAPKYTVLVILDDVAGRRWGGLDAAPIFLRIADQLSTGLNI